jgi:hypothetical protein
MRSIGKEMMSFNYLHVWFIRRERREEILLAKYVWFIREGE